MSKVIHSAVEQVKSNPNKEDEVWAWFRIGAELQGIGRLIKSSKIFGKEVKKTPMGDLPSSDRSDARWMFQNWKTVLQWIEFKAGRAADDPFRMLADLNHSHPSAIRRQVKVWSDQPDEAILVDRECVEAVQAAFATAVKGAGTMKISEPSVDGDGIEYLTQVYDPFSGSAEGRYLFRWPDIADAIKNPSNVSALTDDIWAWMDEMGFEADGDSELTTDNYGRVHFRESLVD